MIQDGRRLANAGALGGGDDGGDIAVTSSRDQERALQILLRYLINDGKVLRRFNPTKQIIQRMNIGQFIERDPSLKQQT